MLIDLASLRANRNLWSRVMPWSLRRSEHNLPQIMDAAFDELDHWNAVATSEIDPCSAAALEGIFTVITAFLQHQPLAAQSTCRRIGKN